MGIVLIEFHDSIFVRKLVHFESTLLVRSPKVLLAWHWAVNVLVWRCFRFKNYVELAFLNFLFEIVMSAETTTIKGHLTLTKLTEVTPFMLNAVVDPGVSQARPITLRPKKWAVKNGGRWGVDIICFRVPKAYHETKFPLWGQSASVPNS